MERRDVKGGDSQLDDSASGGQAVHEAIAVQRQLLLRPEEFQA